MLRTYSPITHPISALHTMLEHLVCEVWCKASPKTLCEDLLSPPFKSLYQHLDWLKTETDYIYNKCKKLKPSERSEIINAFKVNNNIENLCNGASPVELDSLPVLIQKEVKNLLENFYSRLLDIKQVPGEKLDYYNQLVKHNKFNTCPICGLANIETSESKYIEDYDHFFPKAYYPFAAVNFNNLVPTCDKCNKKYKGGKKPLAHNGKAYFPFEKGRLPIIVTIKIDKIEFDNDKKLIEKAVLSFSGDHEKNSTWNWLYSIDERYSTEIKRFSYSWLRSLKKDIEFNGTKSAEECIDHQVSNYKNDEYDEMKFLKIALFNEIKSKPEWMDVYTTSST